MPGTARAALATAALLAACAAAQAPAPVPTGDSHAGHDPAGSGGPASPHPSAPAGADGTIDLESDFALGGSGVGVATALETASSQPVLVTGWLVRDAAGGIWFCDALDGQDPPECGHPRLSVAGLPSDGSVFAPENAGTTGSTTSDGVTWVPDQQLFGVVHPGR
jgi:hypothetical protein